ncbi:hypothetical protein JWJ90_08680 [Desulfobulbus rhabdoformis]|uniref:hypothetical protein n=1 Tax=Desulfobulbus rhabdoformis TaxID=34032 RepID=UPI001963B95B|nr:hypothetical protein [Desulfobulbus rhabdoformis]MBM9614364.1 hypothetical protein [Desulfobulbus rhabdoformis]
MDLEISDQNVALAEPQSGFVERRVATTDRRRKGDRRCGRERRIDPRLTSRKPNRSIIEWVRSITRLRLGVDRRKNRDRRRQYDRRQFTPTSLLSQEELADLLS